MRVLVCGGRDYTNKDKIFSVLDKLHAENLIDCIIEGEAPGADTIAKQWALLNDVELYRVPAEWDKYPKGSAGPIRNQKMLDMYQPDIVLAFGGKIGTPDMIRRSLEQGIKVKKFI